ncbi:MAG: glutamate mutase L [Candidatus Cloacimonetes bacterium]|nr:glutamate mutase L [Candidatus Cloacimonadota bacterium]
MINKKNILITDIGSTTTKVVLFQKRNNKYELIGLEHIPTTVEKPVEDVKIGIYNSIKKLEENVSQKILSDNATTKKLHFPNNTIYLTTSSAGGGLQILVFGLTLFDSASSAKRAAFGSGGVILDTFAINDNRSPIEKMQLIRILRPDIILFSGGTDGGNISSIVRLGELISLANPKPKFGEKTKIPLVYAGNKDAQSFIESLFSQQFDLHIVPNLRPTLKEENLPPSQEKIHQLFMDNVMEQAPGYSDVKQFVSDDIIPTPSGVIKALQLISQKLNQNIVAVDIGGATTDIFSNILGRYYRTVSANYGVSYSISNVMADAGFENIKYWLPDDMPESYIRNYISNKMLYPTYIPQDDYQLAIEHAAAREAIRMAQNHHMKMHFNTVKVGFLNKLKERDFDKFVETFYIEKMNDKRKFHQKDINIMIGAGGIISNSPNLQQSLISIIDGLKPQGITEIWRDNHFISPHLGKLSDVDPELALTLLQKECYQKIALVIKPIYKKMKEEQKVLSITIKNENNKKKYSINSNEIKFVPNDKHIKNQVEIELEKGFYLQNHERIINLNSELPILIDTRSEELSSFEKTNENLNLYKFDNPPIILNECFADFLEKKEIDSGIHTLKRSLPYKGEIMVKIGDKVQHDTMIGENRYDPPKIYVLSVFTINYFDLNSELMKKSMLVKKGDKVAFRQKLIDTHAKGLATAFAGKTAVYHSPVRGIVEEINFNAGTIILREIQDYSTKPVTINVAKKLGISPKHLKGYLKKKENDFVYAYETLASKLDEGGKAAFVPAPSTGMITNIDLKDGTVTIQYKKEPYQKYAGASGKIIEVEKNISAVIEYEGSNLYGTIGFGSEATDELTCLSTPIQRNDSAKGKYKNKIIVCFEKINFDTLEIGAELEISGIIAPSIDNKDLVRFIGEEIGVALTGSEKIPFPIIITEGFGEFSMNETYKEFFKKANGKFAYINGHTQIRAGVVRPKIVVF